MESILVVGGAGKTGHLLSQNLASAGLQPVVFDDLSTGLGDRVTFGPLVKVDARQTPRVIRTLKEHSIQTIVHCALQSESDDPLALFEQNLTTTMSLLQALQEAQGRRIILVNPPALTREMLTRILQDCANAYGYEAFPVSGETADEVFQQIRSRLSKF
ncbi:MAG TPA: NAD-dependent epimerase/dehydratase family protein [Pseudobdellovibrionaceae bacterium]|nr:NAD-dependent epimerase/dehydratase family protein [Pseudobdellovibrionaceae bacterium]